MTEFKNFTDFLHMGGYATYVWSAYGITAGVIAVNVIGPLLAKRQLKRAIKAARPQQSETGLNESTVIEP